MNKKVRKIEWSDEDIRELSDEKDRLFAYYYSNKISSNTSPIEISLGNNLRIRIGGISKEWIEIHNKTLWDILPQQVVDIKHNGEIKILAFSDYRVHNIDFIFNYLKNMKYIPDLIIYAGDDIERFVPPIYKEIVKEIRSERRSRLSSKIKEVYELNVFKTLGGKGIVLAIPKKFNKDLFNIISRIYELLGNVLAILEKYKDVEAESYNIDAIKFMIENMGLKTFIEDRKDLIVVDPKTNILICKIILREPILSNGKTRIDIDFDSRDIYRILHYIKNNQLTIMKNIFADDVYSYYFLGFGFPDKNYFEELAKYSRYGVLAIIGNDDPSSFRRLIRGKNVYEIFTSLVRIKDILIVGLEGSTDRMGPSSRYLESDVRLRLEAVKRLLRDGERLLIVSHTPPRGILDRAMRFTKSNIGSIGLRNFLEENEDKVSLVICGHVHNKGGKYEYLGTIPIVNISSQDNPLSKPNIALITIKTNGHIEIKIDRLDSMIEHYYKKHGLLRISEFLKRNTWLTDNEIKLFISALSRYGQKFLEDLQNLLDIKFNYGFSWNNILWLYSQGIKSVEKITEDVFRLAEKELKGIYKTHFKKAYRKILQERERKIFLLQPLPIGENDHIIVFDTEYYSGMEIKGVLYGFLDLNTNNLVQFWFYEREKAIEYLKKLPENTIFIHWGGADRKLLEEELGINVNTFNLLYYVQTNLVAPIESFTLESTLDYFNKNIKDPWRNYLYIDGIIKSNLCYKILNNPNDEEIKRALLEANKADILALKIVLRNLMKLSSYKQDF